MDNNELNNNQNVLNSSDLSDNLNVNNEINPQQNTLNQLNNVDLNANNNANIEQVSNNISNDSNQNITNTNETNDFGNIFSQTPVNNEFQTNNTLNEGEQINNNFEVEKPLNFQPQSNISFNNSSEIKQEQPQEPKQPKKKKGSVIIVLLILVIIGLLGYLAYDMFFADKLNSNNAVKNAEPKVQEKVLLKDQSKEVVYFEELGKVTDKGTKCEAKERIYNALKVNINSTYAETINKEISDKAKKAYNDDNANNEQQQDQESCSIDYTLIDYEYYVNNNILSVIVIESNIMTPDKNYIVYNINTTTGEKIANNELLKIKNLTEEKFKSSMVDAFKKLEERMLDEGDFGKEQYNKNIENLQNDSLDKYSMFLDVDNNLNVVFKRLNIAGGEYSQLIINLADTSYYISLL